jgi:uncharacterized membrane protein (UPF0127 family)
MIRRLYQPFLVLALVVMVALPGTIAAQRQALPPWRDPLEPSRQQAQITVGTTPVSVELALTGEQQQLGLGYRNGLEPDHGMLFVFEDVSERVFWMRGMRFCLDIIWIQEDRIVGAAENVCPDPEGTDDADRERYPSNEPVSHVLEMDAGWLDAHGYGAGTPVDMPDEVS